MVYASEPVFVDHLRRHSLAESISRYRFLGSINEYKYGLCWEGRETLPFSPLPLSPLCFHILRRRSKVRVVMYTSNAKILQAVSNRWSDLDKRMSVPFMYIPRHGKRRTRFLTVVVLGSAPPFPFLMSEVLFQENERVLYSFPGPVFVNVYGAQSIPRNRFRQDGNRFLGSLNGLRILALYRYF